MKVEILVSAPNASASPHNAGAPSLTSKPLPITGNAVVEELSTPMEMTSGGAGPSAGASLRRISRMESVIGLALRATDLFSDVSVVSSPRDELMKSLRSTPSMVSGHCSPAPK